MTDTPPLTVALVDDDDDLRHATTQLLTLHGFAVTAYSDATTALAAIGADFVGVVVTDVRMPGMSDIEFFRTLAARDAIMREDIEFLTRDARGEFTDDEAIAEAVALATRRRGTR